MMWVSKRNLKCKRKRVSAQVWISTILCVQEVGLLMFLLSFTLMMQQCITQHQHKKLEEKAKTLWYVIEISLPHTHTHIHSKLKFSCLPVQFTFCPMMRPRRIRAYWMRVGVFLPRLTGNLGSAGEASCAAVRACLQWPGLTHIISLQSEWGN